MSNKERNNWIIICVFSVALICGLLLFIRIVWADTSIDSPVIQVVQDDGSTQQLAEVSSGAALEQANERLLQMVQWTLGLVITFGGLLIGYSWFQSRSRYREDQQRMIDYEKKVGKTMRKAMKSSEQQAQLIDSISNMQTTMNTTVQALQGSFNRHEAEISRMRWVAMNSLDEPGLVDAHKSLIDSALSNSDVRDSLQSTSGLLDIGGIYAPSAVIQKILANAIDNLRQFVDYGSHAVLSAEEVRRYSSIFDDLKWNAATFAATLKQVIEWKNLVSSLIEKDPHAGNAPDGSANSTLV